MGKERELVTIFGKCSRLINKAALETGDNFLTHLCFENSDLLMSEFIFFLKNLKGESSHVAQYLSYSKILARINSLLNLFEIIKNYSLFNSYTPLLLERELLLFRSSILDFVIENKKTIESKGEPAIKIANKLKKKNKVISEPASSANPAKEKNKPEEINPNDKKRNEIFETIKNNPKLSTVEISRLLKDTSKRTVERKISELVKLGFIEREARGRIKLLK